MRKLKLLTLLIVICVTVPAWAQSYTATRLPIMGEKSSWVAGINNSGQMVGWLTDSNLDTRAVLWQGSSVIDLGLGISSYAQDINDAGVIVARTTLGPVRIINLVASSLGSLGGQAFGFANAINNSGQITGSSWVIAPVPGSGITRHAYLYTSGSMIDLGTLGGFNNRILSGGTGINDKGWVVGASNTVSTGGSTYGYVYRNAVMEALPSLYLDKNSSAGDINNAGIIVGTAINVLGLTLPNHAAVWEGDSVISIHKTISRQHSFARAINERGDIVGLAINSGPALGAAYLWEAETRFPIGLNNVTTNLDGWFLTQALDINDCGQIVCVARKLGNDSTRAFLLSPAPEITITSPGLDELWIAGEQDTIVWSTDSTACAPQGVDSVKISYSLDFDGSGGSFVTIVEAYPFDTGIYVWDVPDSLLSRKCAISLQSTQLLAFSKTFRIKGYELTRITSVDNYERFTPGSHGWNYANATSNMWPQTYWSQSQFNYTNGPDPFSGLDYPSKWPKAPMYASAPVFPGWPTFVRAFGTDKAYLLLVPGLVRVYRPSQVARWNRMKGTFGGSCYGFAISSLLAFQDSTAFTNKFSSLVNLNQIFNLTLGDAERAAVNAMYVYQFGVAQLAHDRANQISVTPVQTLNLLRSALNDEIPNDVALSFYHQNGSGGHTVLPYKVVQNKTAPNIQWVYIYDSNFPADSTARIGIDTVANTWAYSRMPNWGGTQGLFVEPPIRSFIPYPMFARPRNHANPSPGASAGTLQIHNSSTHDIIIRNDALDSIGYRDSLGLNSIADGYPIIPKTGFPHPPIGYDLPAGDYAIEVSTLQNSIVYLSTSTDSLIYTYSRSDAQRGETDRVWSVGGLRTRNDDGATKTINLRSIVIEGSSEKVMDAGNLKLVENDSIAFEVVGKDQIRLVNLGPAKTYDLYLEYASDSDETIFNHQNINLPVNSTHQIVPVWQSLATIPVTILIDLGNTGTFDDSVFVSNLPVGLDDPETEIVPRRFEMYQNYPNPFNASTEISYSLSAAGHVNLVVYNIVGQRVAVLVDAMQPAGKHRALWNGRDERGRVLSSGVYLYRLTTKAGSVTKKMVLLK